MRSLRRRLATSDDPFVRRLRGAYRALRRFTLPAPRVIVVPALWGYLAARTAIHAARRVFIAEPLFKAYCTRYGKGVTTGIFVHWIQGKGDIILGDYVNFDGKSSINFAARYTDRPTLTVGDYTGISHECSITVGKRIDIGSHVRIASGVHIMDSSGHSTAPDARRDGAPPSADEVRPVRICDNVWIGRRATIFPGVTIGEGSIVSAAAAVMTDVAPYTVVAGNPARKIGSLERPAEPAKEASASAG
jgi:acetyltransferase-like isoleucine patch superfamily enzyme